MATNKRKLERSPKLERALSWAMQNGYCFASEVLDEYCTPRELSWDTDPMYNYVTYSEDKT